MYDPSVALNPLNAELNPISHLLTLLGGATLVVVSRLRVKHKLYELKKEQIWKLPRLLYRMSVTMTKQINFFSPRYITLRPLEFYYPQQ